MWESNVKKAIFQRITWNCGVEEGLRVPWTTRRPQPVHSSRSSLCISWRNDAEAETQYLATIYVRVPLIGKDLMGGEWVQKEKGTTTWDALLASLTQWTWIRVNYRSADDDYRRPGSAIHGLQRVWHDHATGTELKVNYMLIQKILCFAHF